MFFCSVSASVVGGDGVRAFGSIGDSGCLLLDAGDVLLCLMGSTGANELQIPCHSNVM